MLDYNKIKLVALNYAINYVYVQAYSYENISVYKRITKLSTPSFKTSINEHLLADSQINHVYKTNVRNC